MDKKTSIPPLTAVSGQANRRMSDDEIELLCLNLKLDQRAIAIVHKIRNSSPVRLVRGKRNNVRGRYPSRLMGVTIQFESHSCELPLIYKLEYVDTDVREYYDQPFTFSIVSENSKGRRVQTLYTPDFFVVRDSNLEFIECKPEEQLTKISEERPGFFLIGNDGRWHCPSREKALAEYGFTLKISSTADVDPTLHSNLVFLEDFLNLRTPSVDESICSTISEMFSTVGRITLENLLELTVTKGGTSDDIYTLIANRKLYVDLTAEKLENRKYVWVYLNQEAAKLHRPTVHLFDYAKVQYASIHEGSRFVLNDPTGRKFRVVLVTADQIHLESADGTASDFSPSNFMRLVRDGTFKPIDFDSESPAQNEALRIVNAATPKAIEKANLIKTIMERYFDGLPVEGVPKRTFELWKHRWLTGQRLYGSGYAGVIPAYRARGDRKTTRIQPDVLAEMNRLIECDYESSVAKGKFAVFSKLVLWCEQQVPKRRVPSYQTFIRYIGKRPQHVQESKRLGHRGAYNTQPDYPRLEQGTPPHGTRPFQVAHIDHTPLEIELVDPDTGENLGAPSLSLMLDAYSRRVLALYLTFEPPSYRCDMMIVRECVKRWGYLPETIVVDGGSDFRSSYFQTLTAAFEITIKTRPASQPRFGNVIERLFGVSQSEFLHQLRGNTKIRHRSRQVSPSHDPKKLAVWTMEALDERLCDWAYHRYDTQTHGTLKRSPRDVYESTMKLTGQRRHRLLAFDRDFLILTMPSTKKGTAKVQDRGRVKVDGDYYQCDELTPLCGTRVEIRVDPLNIAHAYARIGEKWVECFCNKYLHLARISERDRRLFSDTERQRNRKFSGSLLDRALARALDSRVDEAKEKVLDKQRKRALLLERQNQAPMNRVLGDYATDFGQQIAPATQNIPITARTAKESNSLFATIDTASVPKLSEYKGKT